ncbi:MAG TPA: S41 family peptidase, partial [Steroidobacteraceae bacterium]|nr:S41 family peptidase [Steroidobacteraceae bacterium]
SDLDQLREKWVTKPIQSLTSAHLHPNGQSVVLSSRGRVFVAPADSGRLVQASRLPGVRYRDVVFMPDGRSLLALSDASGELEFVNLPVNGVGASRSLTADGKVLRFEGAPSPDGKWIAYVDNNNDAWLLNVATRAQRLISKNREGVYELTWSPDSRFMSIGQTARNTFSQLWLYEIATQTYTPLTSDRVNSQSAAWSPDGKWIYFLSDRNLNSAVGEPWGPRAPEPFFDKPMKIYQIALRRGSRSPFKPADELHPPTKSETAAQEAAKADAKAGTNANSKNTNEEAKKPVVPTPPPQTTIDLTDIALRINEVPVPAGNYRELSVSGKALYWISRELGSDGKSHLMALEITNKDENKPTKVIDDMRSYELSRDGKKLLVRKSDDLHVFDAGTTSPGDLSKSKLELGAWSYPIDVREDWRQIFIDAWRLERDYFYDPSMHGLNWNAIRDKYLPLVSRITTRDELSDLIGLAVGELSALHTAVREGDMRRGGDDVRVPSLGARLVRQADGYRIDYIYQADPDYPDERSPLADPELGIEVGDVIVAINGQSTLAAQHPNALLRNLAGQQILLRIKTKTAERNVIVTPMADDDSLRYSDWEHTRRLRTESLSSNKIGYVHLRAMTRSDATSWYRNFYPAFDRQGLIIDVRHNRGGNIDSWILDKLLRRAWMYWQGRAGEPTWNMQYAFRGHMVVLVDESTASDGEAFAEGFRRLGLGKVIGVRTWGGEIWL